MPSNFRILHCIESFGVGGAQAMMFELSQAIERYYPNIGQNLLLLDKTKIDEEYIKSYGIEYAFLQRDLFQRTIFSFEKPVVVLYHKLMCSNTDFIKRIYPKIPVVVVNHSYTENMGYNKVNTCDAIVSVSKHMHKTIKRYNPGQKCIFIRNGINAFNYKNVDPIKREEEPNTLITGRINSLNTIKYNDSWLEWIYKSNLPVKLVHDYIGGGNYKKRARKLVSRLKDTSENEVNILGAINHFATKISYVKSWDLFLYEINRNEGISVSLLEALASGVPVVCSNHYGNKEVIENGVNGYIFDSRGELKEILTELALNRKMLDELKATTKSHFIEKLDAKYVSEQYVNLLSDIVGQERPLQRPAGNLLKKSGPNHQVAMLQNIKSIKKKEKSVKKENKKEDKMIEPKPIKEASTNVNNEGKDGKFTILTACRNNKKCLDDWAKSIIKQNYRPIEVVFVDDASSDDSLKHLMPISKRFRDAGIELKAFQNPKRLYCGSSYQIALSHATGNYIGVIDSDDMIVLDAMEYVVGLYTKYPDVTWIYTQFNICSHDMQVKKRGFSRAPQKKGESLLDMGKRRKHAYSHWRTFSDRFPRPNKIFKKGLRCAVDKYMGYRLEEFGKGMFADRVCYNYRQQKSKHTISHSEPTKKVWQDLVKEAVARRARYKLKAHSIIVVK
tara:strand:- start:3561 stop:5576 length:2016 start_codon:yes stop_codon:yes gene_type:complete